ncbi:cytochrome P450 [Streptomyces johnsoniae]|uniref:Cytochrome P450 n=1 Tax=Streptomyces johnsoniae TaxID=3075532 RepID=A0ABU2S2Y7_9ACTN|nr:cytochrome P450 [Streptomyces sp. DSM 41886]MDT0441960.1 cytochrome P450 [Streptomyces sp. DSM 41886]
MSEPSTVPVAPGAVPVLGHTAALWRDPLGFLRQCTERAGVLELKLRGRRGYLVADPKLAHSVLTNVQDFDKGGQVAEQARAVLGNGLLTCPVSEHRRQRRLMQSAFTRERIGEADRVMAEEAERLTRSWHDGETVDFVPAMNELTQRVTIRSLLTSFDLASVDEMISVFNGLLDGEVFRHMVLPEWARNLPLPSARRFAAAVAAADATCAHAVAAARADPGGGGLLNALMAGGDSGEAPFTDEELRHQVVTFLAAGTETTASVLAWFFHRVAEEPALRRRLHEELDAVLGGRTATAQDVPRLPFTQAMFAETLRHHSPTWIIARSATREVDLGGHRFPAGTEFYVSPYQLHHDPAVFPEPERFDPDRWSERSALVPYPGYVPFGAGARICIGARFAVQEAVIAVSALAGRWDLRPVPGSGARPRPRIVMAPNGLHLRAHAR